MMVGGEVISMTAAAWDFGTVVKVVRRRIVSRRVV